MTVSATENRKEHAGNGVTTSFATPVFFNESDVVVYLVNDTTGVSTLWTLNTEYTLSGEGSASGGTLTVDTSPTDYTPASGETLVILTDPTYDQGVDLVNNDALDAEVLEQALDELTVMIQRVDSKIGRAFRFADDAAGTDSVSVDIPTPEASKALRWNSDGDALENVNLSDLGMIATADFAETLLDDPNADAFWATLMASITKATARTSLGVDSQAHPVIITPDSDTDYTPTATELAADVWVLDLSNWTTDRSIICDDADRKFTVINPSTNSYTATITTSGTTPTTENVPSDGQYYQVTVRSGVGVALDASKLPAGHIAGLLWSNNATDATNDFDVSSGSCRSDDGTTDLVLSSTQVKQMDATWATGTSAGALATGATAWASGVSYHVFIGLISGKTEIIVDSDPDATNATSNNGLGKKRHIFSFKAVTGPAIPVLLTRLVAGDVLARLDVTAQDLNASGTTSGAAVTLSVPAGIKVKAVINYRISNSAATYGLITETEQANTAPAASASDIYVDSGAGTDQIEMELMTDTSGQIRHRTSVAVTEERLFTKAYTFLRAL